MKKYRVYLAGGFQSGWQDTVKECVDAAWFDPRLHGLKNPADYTRWDIREIRQCDIVFAYMEADNPGGYALAFEIGYACALGKMVIFVDDTPDDKRRYWAMVRCSVTNVFLDLYDAIDYLHEVVKHGWV